ncbi:hypothetical protein LXA43DRAFT_1061330 [Ganoderma leucocontextum]|nr:hypothetical protein LXA43DRAFT_1061330 [Ganoderma leucocontextum]
MIDESGTGVELDSQQALASSPSELLRVRVRLESDLSLRSGTTSGCGGQEEEGGKGVPKNALSPGLRVSLFFMQRHSGFTRHILRLCLVIECSHEHHYMPGGSRSHRSTWQPCHLEALIFLQSKSAMESSTMGNLHVVAVGEGGENAGDWVLDRRGEGGFGGLLVQHRAAFAIQIYLSYGFSPWDCVDYFGNGRAHGALMLYSSQTASRYAGSDCGGHLDSDDNRSVRWTKYDRMVTEDGAVPNESVRRAKESGRFVGPNLLRASFLKFQLLFPPYHVMHTQARFLRVPQARARPYSPSTFRRDQGCRGTHGGFGGELVRLIGCLSYAPPFNIPESSTFVALAIFGCFMSRIYLGWHIDWADREWDPKSGRLTFGRNSANWAHSSAIGRIDFDEWD